MSRKRKVLLQILSGTADADIRFRDLKSLLKALGFDQRTKGDHWIFTRDDVVEIINFQPRGSLAKPYQVKQVRELILKYRLGDLL